MKDSFGREIDYMRISITDRCNLRCTYCMPPEGVKWVPMRDILSFEEIVSVCRQAVALGITKFRITGGEPLVRRGCPTLVKMIKEIRGTEQVTLTTNGILLKEYLEPLMEAGLDAVNISLDTLDRDKYKEITGFDQLSQVLEAIGAANAAGLKVKINSVLQRGINDNEWDMLLRLAMKQPVDVRFIEMMPVGYGAGREMVSNRELFQKIRQRYGAVKPDNQKHGNGPAVYYQIADFKGSVGFISAIHGKFCGQCNRIRMTSTGELKPCLCYKDSVDVRAVLREGGDRELRRDVFCGPENRTLHGDTGNIDIKIRQTLEEAIRMKPEMHCFEEAQSITERREMAKIGG